MDMPNIVKLTDLVLHIVDDTRVCIKCRFNGMKEYQNFYGNEAAKLPFDILKTLCVESIGVQLEYFPDGICPTLVITASDDVYIVGFDTNQLFQQLFNNSEKDSAQDSQLDENQEELGEVDES